MVKKMSKSFSHEGVVKCPRNLNFEKKDTASYEGKNDGFWLLWGIFKEYLKQNRDLRAYSAPPTLYLLEFLTKSSRITSEKKIRTLYYYGSVIANEKQMHIPLSFADW